MEKYGRLSFLDVFVFQKADGLLGCKVYKQPAQTDLNLHAQSYYHSSPQRAVLSTLIHRARAIADTDSLPDELQYLRKVFVNNGYSTRDIDWTLSRWGSSDMIH